MKFFQLKLLTDENVSPHVVSFLREYGFEILDVKESVWHGKDDKFLLAQSISEQCFILTHDADFGRLIVNRNEFFFGIIYLRLKNLNSENIIRVLTDLIKLDLDIETHTIVVIGEKKVRIRKI